MQHEVVEKNIGLMIVLILLVVSLGGLAEIVPLFYQASTTQPLETLKPWSALALEGRDIYIREGCHVCHTQMVRPLHAETERYGKFSVAEEHVYDHPFLWGSKRTGPDLGRVGGRYSDEWHQVHLRNPRDVVPGSNMPAYPWLKTTRLTGENIASKMKAMKKLGVPYTDEEIKGAKNEVKGKTEEAALIQYLQQLGHARPGRAS
ncbi:MAG: cytochrome-c oxidase, cbb3-type subunit II [Gammaproteobacteria bacterium]